MDNLEEGANQQQFNVRIKRHPELQPYIPYDRFGTTNYRLASTNSSSSSTTTTTAPTNSEAAASNKKRPTTSRPSKLKSSTQCLASRSVTSSRASSEIKPKELTPSLVSNKSATTSRASSGIRSKGSASLLSNKSGTTSRTSSSMRSRDSALLSTSNKANESASRRVTTNSVIRTRASTPLSSTNGKSMSTKAAATKTKTPTTTITTATPTATPIVSDEPTVQADSSHHQEDETDDEFSSKHEEFESLRRDITFDTPFKRTDNDRDLPEAPMSALKPQALIESEIKLRESTPLKSDLTFTTPNKTMDDDLMIPPPVTSSTLAHDISHEQMSNDEMLNFSGRDPDSLLRELENHALAKGLNLDNTADFATPRNSTTPDKRQRAELDEEERRIQIEEELKKISRNEEEEREKRGKLVDSIMARFGQTTI